MSLTIDGVWKAGLWATTVWADGVWREGAPTPPTPPAPPVTTNSGGYTVATTHGERRRLKLPAAEVVAEVAAQQASAPAARLDEHQRREHLIRELELRGLEYEARYWEALERERKAILEARRRRDEEAVFLLACL